MKLKNFTLIQHLLYLMLVTKVLPDPVTEGSLKVVLRGSSEKISLKPTGKTKPVKQNRTDCED